MLMKMFGAFIFVFLAVLVQAQDQSGFISLDCGLARNTNYTEATTGINYISDDAFIDTGTGMTMLPMYQASMQQQMWHVRSFPEGIRNCYKLNLTKGSKYLIRASFMYGNYDGLDKVPEFDLHIGPNKWATIAFLNASFFLSREIIHVLPSSYLHVCLVNTGSGIPFISALEIRPLTNLIYKAQAGISLNLFTRLDVASETNLTVRYKDDIYDRAWAPYHSKDWSILSTSLDIDSGSGNNYKVPPVIMKTAGTPSNASASLDFFLDVDDTSIDFFVFLHFAEIQKLQANESRIFNVTLNGEHWYGPFSPDYLFTTTVFSPSALTGGNYSFSIRMTENSTLPPILNAIEAYSVRQFLEPETEKTDVDAITNIKSMYGVKRDWQGDPCAPQAFVWEGLNCSYDGTKPPRIISLNLSSNGLNGEIPSYLSNLTMLQNLDLSNNNFIGSVPDFLSQFPLRVLNLQGNNLTGSVPIGLLEREKNGSLTLSVGGNSILCSSILCKKKKKNVVVPVVASVSASVVLVVAILALIFFIKRKRKQAGKIETTERNNQMDSFETKNRQFSYSDLLKMTKNFERIIGKGGFGKVYYGRLDNTDVAVKMLSQSSVQGFQQFQAEVQLLMRVHHRNLTSLVGYCDEGNKLALVYEYMANGNLHEYISESSTNILSWEMRLRIAVESAQGLEYLHNGCKPPIIHRDVKSTNILLNEKFQAKLADFGLSKSFPTDANTHVSTVVAGTPGYLDPEYYLTNRLNEKSDVYSFGVVLLEIITSQQVITKTNENDRAHISQWVNILLTKADIKKIVDPRLEGQFDENSVWKAVEVAMACLSATSNKRPNMSHVVMELNESLAAEMARTKEGYTFDQHMMSMSFGSELSPSVR